ncbi:hypothetical protein ALP65_02517 [Pseudomonas aeruginosa]|uniref:Uncharacterized protein n=1 Tax=Pseudomonas aeruginosa TaxID=287 RepID=A0A3M5DDD3_PSEAI|nr:hypothetical protein ALP65_02517 [Pseudomonas aeruginosa]
MPTARSSPPAPGVRYTLSTMSICSLEDIATEVGQPFWFQLYVMRDRDFIERLIDRAKAAGCDALVLTLDLQIIGQRHKDLKNGLSAPPRPTLANLLNIATKPRWALGMLGTRRRGFGNIVGHVKGVDDMGSLSEWTARQFDPRLNWGDVEWIKRRWGGKLVLKGILDAEDARLAADSGADALVVSNHGGRQLDGAPSTISALPAIVEAVGEQLGARFAGLQTESFSVPRWRSGEAPREVRLRFARSQREVSGDSAASLLEQAEAHGLRPAHGCRQGICASCTCVLLSGCVRDLRSGALCSEPGQPIRLCVSAAHGDLALDL